MNTISFGNGEAQKQNAGSALVSSLVSTGITAGAGALGGAGVAKVASLVPTTKPTEGKIIEELLDSGDTFVREKFKTIENANMASLCDDMLANIDDNLEIISKGGRKGLFKKIDPVKDTQDYLRGIMDAIGEKIDDGVELTKEQVKEAVKKKRMSSSTEAPEKLRGIIEDGWKALGDKAKDFLKTAKKGDGIFDRAVKATHKMKNDMRLASFAKWGAIIALGLSIIPNFIPKKAQKETTQA